MTSHVVLLFTPYMVLSTVYSWSHILLLYASIKLSTGTLTILGTLPDIYKCPAYLIFTAKVMSQALVENPINLGTIVLCC